MPLTPLWVCPMDQPWTPNPNVTLIGDAAHVMPPAPIGGVVAYKDAISPSGVGYDGKGCSVQRPYASADKIFVSSTWERVPVLANV
jgi:hypothetical protein